MRTNSLNCIALASIACLATSASAELLFSDNFESSTATPDSWATQNALPNASRADVYPANTTTVPFTVDAGQWFAFNKTGIPRHNVQVTSNATPGAFEGSNYLRLHRAAGTDSANIGAAFAPYETPLTSGIVTAQWEQYIVSANTAGTGFVGGMYMTPYLDNDHGGGTTGSKTTLFFREDGQIRVSTGGFASNTFIASPVAALNTWQTWTMVTNFDNKTFTIDVEGTTSAPLGFNFPESFGAGAVGLVFNGQENQEFYVDALTINGPAVPEPGMASLALAAAGLFLRRRRA